LFSRALLRAIAGTQYVLAASHHGKLLLVFVIASIFDDQTPREISEFLSERGICVTDIVRAFKAVLAGVQGLQFVHGWN
jgi:hypothetical protein